MERLAREVRAELARFGPQGGMPELLAAWPEAVGPMIAANAWPARIARDGTVHVSTSSAAWAFELGQLAPVLVEKLRAQLGESAPKSLRFAVGHVPEPASTPSADQPPKTIRPSKEALQRAADLTAGMTSEELREQVARAAALSLSRAPSDSPV